MNNNARALAALLLLSFFALPAIAAETPKVIDVERTPLHKNLFDIPVAVAPKAGCNFVKTESGAADKNKKIALEASLLRIPCGKLIEEIKNDCLREKKMEVKSHSSFIWNGDRAELLKIFQLGGRTTVGKWVLIVERGDTTWLISALYSAKDANASQTALEIIKSAWWQRGESEEVPSEAAPVVDVSETPFCVADFRGDSLILTKDGKIPTEAEDKALYVISSEAASCYTRERRDAFVKERLSEIEPGAELEIISQREEMLNGVPAIVTVAYAGSGEGQKLIYQAALFKTYKVTLFVGIARGNATENLEYFGRLTASYGSR